MDTDKEMREERVHEEWECGCRMWYVRLVVDDGYPEFAGTIREELCDEMQFLDREHAYAELRLMRAEAINGRGSDEYEESLDFVVILMGAIDKHFDEGVQILEETY